MKRQTVVSALARVGTLVFAGCSGGGAGSASGNGCGGGGYGGSGTVYPANAPYSVPFSSQVVSGSSPPIRVATKDLGNNYFAITTR
jgi:hypothetical protein